ncbi:hypothetical protein pqer_cds_726 [Pandoravirus quercus]|uniref:Uncharacterized protein n=2 Tax=Pandoravirus TaxID=2060084 RepID=A0A2U7U9M0_9VIRU|nr:hypothetical protein pqer_cds_726 [Pandoravirus quercus]AVK75148.1 hypothetical protein pqer_cds_726 [Pandoravirus quercus]QBZ81313.1 hypothetical protein pclt_cds_727 [Pandoravirus celtis]
MGEPLFFSWTWPSDGGTWRGRRPSRICVGVTSAERWPAGSCTTSFFGWADLAAAKTVAYRIQVCACNLFKMPIGRAAFCAT